MGACICSAPTGKAGGAPGSSLLLLSSDVRSQVSCRGDILPEVLYSWLHKECE